MLFADSKPGLRGHLILLLALCALVFAVYANSLANGFAMDAPLLIPKNPAIRQADSASIRTIFTTDYWYPIMTGGLYRPLTILSFLFNYTTLRNALNPSGYHLVNVILHAINVCLVYALAFFLFRRARPAFLAALLWAVHPIGTETVANVAGRADLIATLSLLAALLIFLRRSSSIVLFICMSCALLAKESGAILPGLMLAYDLAYKRWDRRFRLSIKFYASALLCLAAYLLLRAHIMAGINVPDRPFIDNPILTAGFFASRFTAIKVIGLQLLLLLFPLRLSCDYSYNQISVAGWTDPIAWLSLLAVAAILYAVISRRTREPLLFFAAGFFAVAILPSSNLPVLIGSIMAERFLYLPSIAFALAAAALLTRYLNPRLAALAIVTVAVLFGVRTYLRNFDWKDNVSLAAADVRTVPDSVKIHKMYAAALFERSPSENLNLVIEEGELSWRPLEPLDDSMIPEEFPNNLGAYYREKARHNGGAATEEGRRWLGKSLRLLLRARSISRYQERTHEQAELARGRELNGRFGLYQTYLNLGLTYEMLGDNIHALDALRYGRSIDPTAFEFYDAMADVYRRGANEQWANLTLYEKALLKTKDLGRVASLPGAKDACLALADLTAAFHAARWHADARRLKSTALAQRCPPNLLEGALPEGPIF